MDWKHPHRVARNPVTIASELEWPEDRLLDLYWGALMHDVGKVFVEELAEGLKMQGYDPSIILAFIRTHAALGSLFMATVQPLFPLGKICASQYQESIDGSGYPESLRYDQISTVGIIVG